MAEGETNSRQGNPSIRKIYVLFAYIDEARFKKITEALSLGVISIAEAFCLAIL